MTEAIPPPDPRQLRGDDNIDREGLLPFLGRKIFGPSWKTSCAGLAGAAIIAAPAAIDVITKGKPLPEALPAFGLAFALAVLGRMARAEGVTSEDEQAAKKPRKSSKKESE